MNNLQGGFDLDGVLALTQQSLFKELQNRGFLVGREFTHIKTWQMENAFPGEVSTKDIIDVFRSPKFWERIEVCPLLLSSAKTLAQEYGVDLHIVTARTPSEFVGNVEIITRKWLYQYDVPYERVAFVPAEHKHLYCIEKNLDFFVEDRTDTAVRIGDTNTTSYLVATTYNREVVENPWKYGMLKVMNRSYYPHLYDIHYQSKVR